VRVRLNEITIQQNRPSTDFAHDGSWFFAYDDYRDFSGGYEAATDIDWSLLHELAHQLGIIDLYQYNIPPAGVEVRESSGDGANLSYRWEDGGLMSDIGHFFSTHTVDGANSTWGYRRGYYGEYQFSMPRTTWLRVLDNTGAIVPDAQVALFQRNGPPDWTGGRAVDNIPEITGTTDALGRFRLPNRPIGGPDFTTTTGHTLRPNPFGPVNVVGQINSFLVRVTKGDYEEFSWLHVTDLNEAFAAGSTASYVHRISTRLPASGAPPAPMLDTPEVEGSRARLCWSPVSGATKYTVYGITPPDSRYEEIATVTGAGLATRCIDVTHLRSTVYAVSATTGAANLEGGLSNTEWTPKVQNPVDLKEDRDGNIVVLDPQNGQNLLRMNPDGRYLQSMGSEHFHLAGARYFANDENDNYAFSFQQQDPHTDLFIRMADADIQPTGGITEPLQGPAGVEFWGDPGACSAFGQPADYQAGSTLLLVRFEDSLTDEGGVAPASSSGIGYAAGRHGKGVQLSAPGRLSYATDHINLAEGSIQFWVKPSWNGNDGVTHVFFDGGQAFNNGMRIQKDGAGNLRFMLWDGSVEYGVGRNVGDWEAGEWHLVGAKWQGTSLSLHIDGANVAATDNGSILSAISGALHIGSMSDGNGSADATFDELVIRNSPLFPYEDCDFATVVADRGNNLLRAFDLNGNLIDSHAGLLRPEGVAIAPDGTVWVVDGGNNRIRTFEFDGEIFSPGPIITGANLNAPTAIDIASNGEVAVSDTGNNVVKLLDPDGNLLQTLNTPVDGYTGRLFRPGGVLYHSNGGVFVADTGNRRVVRVRLAPVATPVPTQLFLLGGGIARIYYQAPSGLQPFEVQQSPGLHPASWTGITPFTEGLDLGRRYVEFPAPPVPQRMFYRLAFPAAP